MDTPKVDALRLSVPVLREVLADLDLSKRSLAAFLKCEPKVIRAWLKGEHVPDGIRALTICALHRARARRGDGQAFKDWFTSWLSTHKGDSLERLLEAAIVGALDDESATEVRAAARPVVASNLASVLLKTGVSGYMNFNFDGYLPPPDLLPAVAEQHLAQLSDEAKAQLIQAVADRLVG